MNEYTIFLKWDDEAQVWYCTSEDIPGLILESGSLDVLVERARHAAPELLELMGRIPGNASLSNEMRAPRSGFVRRTIGHWEVRNGIYDRGRSGRA